MPAKKTPSDRLPVWSSLSSTMSATMAPITVTTATMGGKGVYSIGSGSFLENLIKAILITFICFLGETLWMGRHGDRGRGWRRNHLRHRIRGLLPCRWWRWTVGWVVGPPKFYLEDVRWIRVDGEGRSIDARERIARREARLQRIRELGFPVPGDPDFVWPKGQGGCLYK